eukprot:CAMPEP_0184291568 /NCGR_PEP_ID=MMETSP1049-20130417/3553_1 /TAXON_ID=77928 /ORGANISM="Proteomonas sulcata, Strain CCMP704" /LENGTH=413 /DNA_ID=CAMNT_0026599053 /DNA_START=491 /DNA_END=1734 /DNA_ORIENTATION=-
MKKGSWMFGGVGFSPFSLIFVLLLSLSVFGILEVPVWVLIGMYLLCRLAGGGYEFMKDQEGYEPGVGSKPGYGFSMVQGRRPYMEDFLNCSLKFGQGGNSSFFVVLDGHSGKRAAQWGKENLPRNLESALQNQTPENALAGAFLKTDADFLQAAAKEGLGDGSTVTSALLMGKELYVANAGDSRTILCRGATAIAMSDDHKPDKPSERKRITRAGGTVLFCGCARVNGILATSRGFGDKELKKYVISEPDVNHRTLSEGDDFLVLATDGLWDVLSNREVAAIVNRERDAHAASKRLTSEALRHGSMDNVSALVVDQDQFFKRFQQALQGRARNWGLLALSGAVNRRGDDPSHQAQGVLRRCLPSPQLAQAPGSGCKGRRLFRLPSRLFTWQDCQRQQTPNLGVAGKEGASESD